MKDSTAGAPPKDWPQKMQELSRVLTDLLPYVAAPQKFNDKANYARIEKDTADLKALAHALKTGAMPNNDPSMKVVSQLFDDDIGRALASLQSGGRDYARRVLSDTTSYCIQCHTQTNNGPEFPHMTMDLDVKNLKPLDRAEFLAATRQFEPALKAYREALSNPDLAREDQFAFETATRSALAISVRVHKDAREADTIVKTLKKNKGLTPAFSKTVGQWDKSITAWRKEKKRSFNDPLAELNEAERLIAAAQKVDGAPLDHSQDITYFRASAFLHDLLQRPNRPDELSARALYLSGLASEATRDSDFWTTYDSYYEECIRTRPLSEQAKQCYSRLETSVLAGYSGSSGTHVPSEIQKRLDSFQKMAYGAESLAPEKQPESKSDAKPEAKPETK